LLVSTSYPARGDDWPGLFIRRITHALAARSDLSLRLWAPPGEIPADVIYVATEPEQHWLARLMQAGGIAHLLRNAGARGVFAGFRLLLLLRALYRREIDIDVYHVNWLQNALALERNRRPLLVTVLGTDMRLLKLPGVAMALRRVFRRRRVAICPNARWMVPLLRQRFGNVAKVDFVPFGIEPRWFDMQRASDMPATWLCVSRVTHGKMGSLFEACAPFFEGQQRELHLFGPMQEPVRIPPWVRYHGAVTTEALYTQWFPRAAGLITMSQHSEGWPQVMLEAMAAGLPIIASRIAAHEDMLQHGQTGWLCGSGADLERALEALEDAVTNKQVGARARAWARDTVGTWDDCAARYAGIYHDLLHEPGANG